MAMGSAHLKAPSSDAPGPELLSSPVYGAPVAALGQALASQQRGGSLSKDTFGAATR